MKGKKLTKTQPQRSSRTLRSTVKKKKHESQSDTPASMLPPKTPRRHLSFSSSDSDDHTSTPTAPPLRPPPPPPPLVNGWSRNFRGDSSSSVSGSTSRPEGGKKNYSPESGFEDGRFSTDSELHFIPGETFFSDNYWEEDDHPEWGTPQKIAVSTRRLSDRRPVNHYIAYTTEGELHNWWSSHRTDYTYSASISYRASNPQKKVGSPNMARRALKGQLLNTKDTPVPESQLSPSNLQQHYEERSRRWRESSAVMTDSSDDEGDGSVSIRPSLPSYLSSYNTPSDTRRHTSSTTTTSVTRQVRYGLDCESDGEDFIAPSSNGRNSRPKSSVLRRAMPLVASGTTGTSSSASTTVAGYLGHTYNDTHAEPLVEHQPSVARRTLSVVTHTVRWLVVELPQTLLNSVYHRDSDDRIDPHSLNINGNNSRRQYVNTERVLRSGRKFYSTENDDGVGADTVDNQGVNSTGAWQSVSSYSHRVSSSLLLSILTLLTTCTTAVSKVASSGGSMLSAATAAVSSTGTTYLLRPCAAVFSAALSGTSKHNTKVTPNLNKTDELELSYEGGTRRRTRNSQRQQLREEETGEEVLIEVEDQSARVWWWWIPLLMVLCLLLFLMGAGASGLSDNLPSHLSAASVWLWSSVRDTAWMLASVSAYTAQLIVAGVTGACQWLYSSTVLAVSWLYASVLAVLSWLYTALTTIMSVFTGLLLPTPAATDQNNPETKPSVLTRLGEYVTGAPAVVLQAVQSGATFVSSSLASGASTAAGAVVWFVTSAGEALYSLALAIAVGVWWLLATIWFGLCWLVSTVVSQIVWLFSAMYSAVGSGVMFILPSALYGTKNNVIHTGGGAVSVDELVNRLLMSEELQQKLGATVLSEVQKSSAASKVESANDLHTLSLLQNLQEQHLTLQKQINQLNVSLLSLQNEEQDTQAQVSAQQKLISADKEQLQSLQVTLQSMNDQISAIEQQQLALSANMKSCCNKPVLSLADVESHVTGLIGSLIGFSSSEGKQPSLEELKAWLSSYFVAKDEMDRRFNELSVHLQEKIEASRDSDTLTITATSELEQESREQTQQLVMAYVTEQLHGEFRNQIKQELIDGVTSASKAAQDDLNARVEAEIAIVETKLGDALKQEMVSQLNEKVVSEVRAGMEEQSDKLREDITVSVSETVKDEVRQVVSLSADTNERLIDDKILTAIEGTLPAAVLATVSSNTIQRDSLNETVKEIVKEAIALHVASTSSGSTCGGTASSTGIPAALLQAAGTLSATSNVNISGAANGSIGLSRRQVEGIVSAALKKYDADRTGLADHALETGGGSIVSTRCTEPYEINQAQLSLLGIPVYRFSTNTPRSIIQPDRNPGQCWAFKGSQGYVVIRLVEPVRPTGFTLEHIPRELTPHGSLDSAPKDFSVWGLNSENEEGVMLGSYQYDEHGEPLQYFPVEDPSEDYYPFIELKIDSNYGNMRYTCVYRIRVHGLRMRT